jgi:hypothetical protein
MLFEEEIYPDDVGELAALLESLDNSVQVHSGIEFRKRLTYKQRASILLSLGYSRKRNPVKTEEPKKEDKVRKRVLALGARLRFLAFCLGTLFTSVLCLVIAMLATGSIDSTLGVILSSIGLIPIAGISLLNFVIAFGKEVDEI